MTGHGKNSVFIYKSPTRYNSIDIYTIYMVCYIWLSKLTWLQAAKIKLYRGRAGAPRAPCLLPSPLVSWTLWSMIDTLYLSLMSMRLLWFKTRFVFYRSWVVLFLSVSWLASLWCILTACDFVLASSSFFFHFNSLFGHLVPYKHQRQVPNNLEIIHVATLVRAHTHAHTHTRTHTHTWLFPP